MTIIFFKEFSITADIVEEIVTNILLKFERDYNMTIAKFLQYQTTDTQRRNKRSKDNFSSFSTILIPTAKQVSYEECNKTLQILDDFLC